MLNPLTTQSGEVFITSSEVTMNVSALEKVALSIRSLSMDAIQKAKSGHPGLPLGCAELASVLYGEILNHNPKNAAWLNRDRFVLSAGHGSMLLYSILHLSGYDVSLDDIKDFRQLDSKCPGHPEYGVTPGVECTTGPLGQGIAMATGMALAETMLAAKFNTENHKIVDHYTYALVGEGCLMEGVSSEASSFAGAYKLGKLIVFYDENKITIDGSTDIVFSEDIQKRYEAYGWQVLRGSMYNMEEIAKLVESAKADDRPSLIILKSAIGKGAPTVEGKSAAHGAPIGEEGVAEAKKNLGLNPEEHFFVAKEAYDYFAEKQAEYAAKEENWNNTFDAWAEANPELLKLWNAYHNNEPVSEITDDMFPTFEVGENLATRSAAGKALTFLTEKFQNYVGGSADLCGPNAIKFAPNSGVYSPETRDGRYINFGIREFAMSCICNGLALHGGLKPFCGTFLVFADYLRPALRLSSLMNLPVVYIFTHDSIYVGEDGPTHQPVELVSSLRGIPGVQVLRPADAQEAVEAWKIANEVKDHPVCICLTRQNIPVFEKEDPDWKNTIKTGAYIAKKAGNKPDVTILATGSEVSLALEAASKSKKAVRVVSVLDKSAFEKQPQVLIDTIIGGAKKVVVAEAGISQGWEGFATSKNDLFNINRFGTSAPANIAAKGLGFTADNLLNVIEG